MIWIVAVAIAAGFAAGMMGAPLWGGFLAALIVAAWMDLRRRSGGGQDAQPVRVQWKPGTVVNE